jgi:hypothetical protein
MSVQGQVAHAIAVRLDSNGRIRSPAKKTTAAQPKLDAGGKSSLSQCRANHCARATQVRHSSARGLLIPAPFERKAISSSAAVMPRPIGAFFSQTRLLFELLSSCFFATLLVLLRWQLERVDHIPNHTGTTPAWRRVVDNTARLRRRSERSLRSSCTHPVLDRDQDLFQGFDACFLRDALQ